ncbi:DUF6188 family protein, partial [Mycobacteroides chelonae]|uniref:DUF6188 family protein n=1 Tax=Mycobacteroides chelonae TaxID=1774 RepID=UPI000AA693A5
SFARVTLVGPSKNHAMTFNHSATTRRYRSSGPTRTPLCWTQPDDHAIDVPHHDFDTAWEIYGKYHGYVASLPRGKVRVVRHDVPEEAGA